MATNITTSRRTGVTNVSNTDNNYHDNDSEEERKEENCKGRIHRKGQKVKGQESMPDLRQTIMSKHIETRRKVADIADISSFTRLINSSTLSSTDKQLLVLHYIDHKDFRYIGDMLGYSESTIKRRHKKALVKLSNML